MSFSKWLGLKFFRSGYASAAAGLVAGAPVDDARKAFYESMWKPDASWFQRQHAAGALTACQHFQNSVERAVKVVRINP